MNVKAQTGAGQEQTEHERTGQGRLEQDRTGRTGQHITAQRTE